MPAVRLREVSKHYQLDSITVPALQDVSTEIADDGFTVLCGPSGSGKTTLLNLIGALDKPDSGEIEVAGQSLLALEDDALSDFRARHIGFVFQHFNLLPVLTAFENVEYPLILAGVGRKARQQQVSEMLAAVGLASRMDNVPGQLSGGQRQRVAIARALIARPKLVLADEPTANLDSQTGAEIITLMRQLQRDLGIAFVFSSHDSQIIAAADRLIRLKDGQQLHDDYTGVVQ